MPLRDHFHGPLWERRSWEAVHGGWPMIMVTRLAPNLPRRYVAEPRVHPGSSLEIDVAAFEDAEPFAPDYDLGGNGGVATSTWAPSKPTLAVPSEVPHPDEYEVRVYDTKAGRRLVAAVEIVSPSNKERPESRRAFVAKCESLLRDRVCVVIVDLVTNRTTNLYAELLESLGQVDPSWQMEPSPLYAVSCRRVKEQDAWLLQSWAYPLAVGQLLPILPLWLAQNFAVPLELEASYEETCRYLRIP